MKKIISFLSVLLIASQALSVQADSQYISYYTPTLIGDYAFTLSYNNAGASLAKYEFPSMTKVKEIDLGEDSYSFIYGSEKGFVVENYRVSSWESIDPADARVKAKVKDISAIAVMEKYREEGYFNIYNFDLEKTGEFVTVNEYIFNYSYDDESDYYDDSNTVSESSCSKIKKTKKKGKASKCKKILLGSKQSL